MKNLEKVNVVLTREKVLKYDERIKSQEDIIDFIIQNEELDIKAEMECYVIVLNIKNEILGYSLISKGGLNNAVIDIKNIFKRVLLLNGEKIIILKNNPSRNDGFSSYDREFKNKLQQACDIMQVKFLDFITTTKKYTSLFTE